MLDPNQEQSFYERVVANAPGGNSLAACLQCGTCGGSCPSGADMDHTPRHLFAMVMAGMEEEVLSSNTPWYCVSCYYCTERCPQGIPITDLMYALKQMAIARGHFHRDAHVGFSNSFIGYIEQYGRSFEFGLATRHHMLHRPLDAIRKSGLGLDMIQKGRLSVTPEHIQNMPQLTAILDEAKRIANRGEV